MTATPTKSQTLPNTNLFHALEYLRQLIRSHLQLHFKGGKNTVKIQPLNFEDNDGTPFTEFIMAYQLSTEELVVLLMALAPHIDPGFYDGLVGEFLPDGGNFPAFGGAKGTNHRGMLPTGETVLFVLGGNDMNRRFQLQPMLSTHHFFEQQKIVYLETVKLGEPALSGKLILDPDYVDLFTLGIITLPKLSTNFPAQHINTELEWNDLVLNEHTAAQIRDLETWVQHNDTLMYDWGMHKRLKPGYRALFYGPPGTGKTLTATLLGKYTNKNVFRIDLSMVVSKYIGETEKNLANLFDKAQNKNWILFFDEADSIFGKRTNVRDAHDKYANQEVAYLLQRIERYPGLTILASNFKSNIDEAFTRRFNSIVYFPLPKPAERLSLWKKAFPEKAGLTSDVSFEQLAKQYELTGSHIMNIVQYVCLNALGRNTNRVSMRDIIKGVRAELSKEGKVSK